MGHVWTTPALQEESGVRLAVGCKSCVRPVRAVLMTAGQITHEKSEWAYAVYVLVPYGCIYSNRFEYDADKPGDRKRAHKEALKDYLRSRAKFPGCNVFSDT